MEERKDVGTSNGDERDEAKYASCDGGDFEVVYWADEWWMRHVRELAGEPGVDWVGCASAAELDFESALKQSILGALFLTYPAPKSKRAGVLSGFALGPMVG